MNDGQVTDSLLRSDGWSILASSVDSDNNLGVSNIAFALSFVISDWPAMNFGFIWSA